jgi:hypothetical protein
LVKILRKGSILLGEDLEEGKGGKRSRRRRLGEGERGGEEEVREEVGWGSGVGSF